MLDCIAPGLFFDNFLGNLFERMFECSSFSEPTKQLVCSRPNEEIRIQLTENALTQMAYSFFFRTRNLSQHSDSVISFAGSTKERDDCMQLG